MGTTTFSGPIKAGTLKDTTGSTVGTNVANVGSVVMAQSAVLDIIGADALNQPSCCCSSKLSDCRRYFKRYDRKQ